MEKKIKKAKFLRGFTPAPKCCSPGSIKSPNKFVVRGFTMVEVIAIIAVMAIMLTVAIINLTGASNDTKLKSAQREVASAIKTAKSYALQGKTVSGNVPKYWGFFVNIAADNKTYKMVSANTPKTDLSNAEIYSLSNGVTISSVAGIQDRYLYFSVPNGTILKSDGSAYNSSDSISLTLSLGSSTKTITITSGGVVAEP